MPLAGSSSSFIKPMVHIHSMQDPKDSNNNLSILVRAARLIGVPDWKFVEFVERCQEAGEDAPADAAVEHHHDDHDDHDGSRQQTRDWTGDELNCFWAVSKTTGIRVSRILRFAHGYRGRAGPSPSSSGTTPASSRHAGGLPADGVLPSQDASPAALSVRARKPPCGGSAQQVPAPDDFPIEWLTDVDLADYVDPLSDLGEWTPDSAGPVFGDQDDTVVLVSMSEALPPPSQSQSQSQSPQAQSRQQSVNQYSPQAAQQQQPELTYEIIPHPRRNDTTAARALPEAGSRSQAAGVRKHQRRVGSKGGNQGKHQQTCVACKIAHKMCVPAANGAMICQRCQRQAYSMSRLGCVYFSIVDITLFRTMTDPISHKAYTSLTISQQLCGRVERRLLGPAGSHLGLGLSGGRGGGGRGGRGGLLPFKLTQGFGTYLHLEAQRFDVNDIISTEQLTPSEQDLYSHPYSIAGDYLTLKKACEDFVRDSKGHYIAAKTSSGDALTQNMFKAAIGYAANKTSRNDKDHEFLRTVLNFWTAARTIEGGWRLEGPEFLGLVPDENGQVPLRKAPYIDYQFSSVMVQHVLFPLRDSVLKQLNSMILSKAANHWFVIFLSTFILLHTCTLLLQQQRDFTRRRGTGKERYSNMKLVTSIHEAAKTLLAFFHQICKGKTLLDVDWERAESVKRIARISEIEANFLKYLVGVVEKRVDEFANLAKTDDYHADLWFTGQMFVRDWKPPYVSDVSPSCQG